MIIHYSCDRQKLAPGFTSLIHPLNSHRFPPPWATQNALEGRADLMQPSWEHLLPPPCATQKELPDRADFVHPSKVHRTPPPWPTQNELAGRADFVQPSNSHLRFFRVFVGAVPDWDTSPKPAGCIEETGKPAESSFSPMKLFFSVGYGAVFVSRSSIAHHDGIQIQRDAHLWWGTEGPPQ